MLFYLKVHKALARSTGRPPPQLIDLMMYRLLFDFLTLYSPVCLIKYMLEVAILKKYEKIYKMFYSSWLRLPHNSIAWHSNNTKVTLNSDKFNRLKYFFFEIFPNAFKICIGRYVVGDSEFAHKMPVCSKKMLPVSFFFICILPKSHKHINIA